MIQKARQEARAELLKLLRGAGRGRSVSLSVVHAALHQASFPVVVGHHAGEALLSAELVLDRVFEGRLGASLRVGHYPSAAEDQPLIRSAREARPPGVVVVGLGRVEEFQEGVVKTAVRSAVLQLMLEQSGGVRGLSFLLIGARTLGEESALRAILSGIVQAHDALEELGPSLRGGGLERVEFIEIYQDRAGLAAALLKQMELPTGRGCSFELAGGEQPQVRAGARRYRLPERVGVEWPVRATLRHTQGGMEFSLATRRSGIPASDVAVWEPLREELIARIRAGGGPAQVLGHPIGQVLRNNFLPQRWRDALRWDQPLQLILDRDTAQMPWELVRDDLAREPPATRAPITRQLVDKRYQARPLASATELRVLLAGDFELQEWALPAARKELLGLAARFEGELARAKGFSLLPLLMAEDSQSGELHVSLANDRPSVVHISAHGYSKDGLSGVVLPGAGPRERRLLTGTMLSQLFETMPRLVFLNACWSGVLHSGVDQPLEPSVFAPTMAEALISAGAQAVVVTGWPVGDGAAQVFAQTFWEAMVAGEALGVAGMLARQRTWRSYGEVDDSWGAYQIYGDPGFRLVDRESASRPSPKTRLELLAWVEVADDAGELMRLEGFLTPEGTDEGGIQAEESVARLLEERWLVVFERAWFQGAAGLLRARLLCIQVGLAGLERLLDAMRLAPTAHWLGQGEGLAELARRGAASELPSVREQASYLALALDPSLKEGGEDWERLSVADPGGQVAMSMALLRALNTGAPLELEGPFAELQAGLKELLDSAWTDGLYSLFAGTLPDDAAMGELVPVILRWCWALEVAGHKRARELIEVTERVRVALKQGTLRAPAQAAPSGSMSKK